MVRKRLGIKSRPLHSYFLVLQGIEVEAKAEEERETAPYSWPFSELTTLEVSSTDDAGNVIEMKLSEHVSCFLFY